MSQLPDANAESRLPGSSLTIGVNVQRRMDAISRAVCRIDFSDGESGTGILLGGRWLLTCHHVLYSPTRAGQVKAVIFGYERGEDDQLQGGTSLQLAPTEGFFTSNPDQTLALDQHDDWTLVRVAADPRLADFGQAQLHEDAIIEPGKYARIIQHPGVAEKSSAEGRIDQVHGRRITYRINTEGGSSGSPVINIEGKIIALHHRGTDQTQPYHNSGVLIQRIIAAITKTMKATGNRFESPFAHLVLPPVPSGPFKLSGLPSVNAKLVGREKELDLLDEAWDSERPYIIGVIGEGGQGKTVLLHTWLRAFRLNYLRGAGCVLVHSFYAQGTRRGASSKPFFSEAFRLLELVGYKSDEPNENAIQLAKALRKQKTLLILDGVEPLQEDSDGPARLDDLGLKCLLRELAMGFSGVCVLTSRQPIRDLAHHQEDRDYLEMLVLAVEQEQRVEILVDAGVSAGTATDTISARLAHSLSSRLLGKAIQVFLGGDAALATAWFPGTGEISPQEVLAAVDQQLSEPQRKAMWILGLFDRPASQEAILAVCAPPAISGFTEALAGWKAADWESIAASLRSLDLLWQASEAPTDYYDSHPLIREYFGQQLRQRQPEAFRLAHSRLFDHLCASTEHRPDTLAGLQPLYQAVTHGCLAGRQQEACDKVYIARILRGMGSDGFYSTTKLGAIGADLGAVAAFFDEPWNRLSPHLSPPAQAWLLNEAASRLRALGRLTEAVEPMRVGLEMRIKQEAWKSAAIIAANLSELEVMLGRLGEAVADGRRAIEFADRSRDAFHELSKRCTAADALHQAGERTEAGALFAGAERMQAERQPEFPLLYSLPGFRYADLLLAPAERAAWQATLDCGSLLPLAGGSPAAANVPHPSLTPDAPALAKPEDPEQGQETHTPAGLAWPSGSRLPQSGAAEAAIAEAERRTTQTLEWAMFVPNARPLDIALDHLIQARAALYRALLTPDPPFDIRHSSFEIATALTKLRDANSLDYLPQALLTAALYHGTLGGDPAEAARLLDEAQQIAERGPMPLYLADVHLHRARFAGMRKDEWRMTNGEAVDAKAELAKARELIEKHGYWRRREELEDAEAAAVNW